MAGWLIDQIIEWLATAILATLTALWGLLEQTVFVSPDVTVLPQVVTISGRSQMIVNTVFVLAIIAVGVTVMTHETVQVRYGVGDLIPRLVVGFIAANFATPICSHLIETANALTGAITGDGIDAEGSFDQMRRVVEDALSNGSAAFLLVIIGLIIAVLTGMLLVAYLVRIGVLVVLVGIAPVALACHATPFTDPAAKLWWRAMLGVLTTVVLQALAMHTALAVFLDPAANVGALGIPNDPTGVGNLFIVACLLWVTVKIPGMMRRYVTRGQHSNAGLFLRMILIQAVSQMVRLPFGRRGGRAAAAAGAGGRRAAAGTAGGPSVANTAIGYWRPRMPRPTPGGSSTSAGSTSGGGASTSARPAAGASSSPPPRSTRLPIRAAGLTPPPPPSGPPPNIPPAVNPATAMPKTRPVRPPDSGPWNRPPRPRRT